MTPALVLTLLLPPGAVPCAWEDLSGDTEREVVWLSASRRRVVVASERAPGRPLFEFAASEELNAPQPLDVDGDGRAELVWSGRISGTIHVLDGGPTGFARRELALGYSIAATVAVADVAGDETPELLFSQEGFPARVLAVSTPDMSRVRTYDDADGEVFLTPMADFDGDGRVEVVRLDTAYRPPPHRLSVLDRVGTRSTASGFPVRVAQASDLDGDGRAEVWIDHEGAIRSWSERDGVLVEQPRLPLPDCRLPRPQHAPEGDRVVCLRDDEEGFRMVGLHLDDGWVETHRSQPFSPSARGGLPGVRIPLQASYGIALEEVPGSVRIHRLELIPSHSQERSP